MFNKVRKISFSDLGFSISKQVQGGISDGY